MNSLRTFDDGSQIDIESLPAMYAGLLDTAMRYRALIELSPDAILVCRQNALVLVNQAAYRLLAIDGDSHLLGRSILDFVRADFHAAFRRDVLKTTARIAPLREQVWMRQDGTPLHVEIAMTALLYDGAPALQIAARDITERKRAAELQAGQTRILNMVATGAPLAGILNAIARLIEAASEHRLRVHLLPLTGETGLSDGVAHSIHGKEGRLLGKLLVRGREPIGTARDAELLDMGARLAAIAMESRATEERMRRLAHYDGLTALPNRVLFREYLDLALRSARRHGGKFALLFLDLDDFKKINDSLGHAAGDLALQEVAARLRGALRHTDKVARMGGDEFYVLIEDLSDARHAAEVAQKLVDEVSRPLHVNGRRCALGASIGIAIYPDDGMDAASLLENSDRAMYDVKEGGKSGCRFFSPPRTRKEGGVLPAS